TRAMKVLVTGAAGFIGHHVTRRLAETGRCEVLGIDTLDAYYDPALPRWWPTGGRTTWCTSRRSRGCGTA
ncbi:MAG: hypothetical protein RL479_1690, partial [Verrucomicrobiota bacterium]